MLRYLSKIFVFLFSILAISNQGFAIDREIFDIRLGEKLDTSSFTKEENKARPYIYVKWTPQSTQKLT